MSEQKEPPKRTRHEGTATVTVTEKYMGDVVSHRESTEKVPVPESTQHVAHPVYITVKGGVTRSPIPYNSVQVQVAYSVPVYPGITSDEVTSLLDGLEDAYRVISDRVERKVQDELALALGEDVNPQQTL